MNQNDQSELENKIIIALIDRALDKALDNPEFSLHLKSIGAIRHARELLYGSTDCPSSNLEMLETTVKMLRSTLQAKEVENELLLNKFNRLFQEVKANKNAASIIDLESTYSVPNPLGKIKIPEYTPNEVKVDEKELEEV